MIHFLPKPEAPILTRAERLAERIETEKQILFVKFYGLAVVILLLMIWFVRVCFWESELEILHDEICDHVPSSLLCTDYDFLERVNKIAEDKNVPVRLLIGVWNAESTLGTHFNKPICSTYHNWAGLKWRKFDDGHVEMFAINRKKPDENGCWLYKFDDLEQATQSLANTIALWYKGCNMKTECIAYDFVWDPNIAEPSWISRVSKFYKT